MPRGRDGGVNGPDQLQVRRTSDENLSKALGDMRAHGDHALLQASWDGQNEIIKRLVKAGCNNVNTARWDNAFGCTAIASAAWTGQLETVKELLAQNADPNIASKFGETALDYAKSRGHSEIVTVLLAAGCRSNRP
mmetsp:Transcript_16690/g.28412  ORF Transcript_16690/g.28412 Transcript_16690/m.28412 type:complete len:136 (-) Transcript_16690:15-422(-)